MTSLRTRLANLCCIAALVVLALGTLPALHGNKMPPEITAMQGPPPAVPALYFGMHVHRLLENTPWPSVPFGAIRLWDTGTTWSDLEPQRDVWRFNKLDRLVGLAAEHRTEVLLCFGRTPQWASSIASLGGGDTRFQTGAPAHLDDWRAFVRTVATRYQGKIKAYEVWNEPNARSFYNGEMSTMVEMTRIAFETIHSVDPGALVLSPSASTTDGLPWLESFLAQGGGRYVDVLAYHLYVYPEPPEKIPLLVTAVKSLMRRHNVALPLWDTETGWSNPKMFSSDDEAAGYVARSLLLAWASGASRFYWYAWDNRNWVTLNLTSGDAYEPTEAAQAFQNVESWMRDHRIHDCVQSKDLTWVCRLIGANKDSFVFWNPAAKVRFSLPVSAGPKERWTVSDLRGNTWQAGPEDVYADRQPRILRQHN